MTDIYNRRWILEHAIPIVQSYGGNISLRALHYRLVSLHGFPNTQKHYKRSNAAMTKARWDGLLSFDDFVDHDRKVIGDTAYEATDLEETIQSSIETIDYIKGRYHKNPWENQPNYIEVWIEKKALIGPFEKPCKSMGVALAPCKGYPSLTFLDDARKRLREAEMVGKKVSILYFGDYDPSGEDIPRSIQDTFYKMGSTVIVDRFALMEEQVVEMNLPPAPTKSTDSRSAAWDGIGQVELDAIEPRQLSEMATAAINEYFDLDLWAELQEQEREEKAIYIERLDEHFNQ
jgi:hypothetical protein